MELGDSLLLLLARLVWCVLTIPSLISRSIVLSSCFDADDDSELELDFPIFSIPSESMYPLVVWMRWWWCVGSLSLESVLSRCGIGAGLSLLHFAFWVLIGLLLLWCVICSIGGGESSLARISPR